MPDVDLSLVDRLGAYATPTLYEAAPNYVMALAPGIAPLFRPIKLVGPAYPIQAGSGDNLAVHLALEHVPGGAVLVVATGGNTLQAGFGEILMEAALARSVRGLVTDGAVRDTRAIRDKGFPVFCAAVAIAGTIKRWPGLLNQPVIMGGATIRPGDYVVGDDDGVVVVVPDGASETLDQAQARVEKENAYIQRIRQGGLTVDLMNLRGKSQGTPQ
jgi:4-hydroxy-4-methyl-2-oxoglutarate aldolase